MAITIAKINEKLYEYHMCSKDMYAYSKMDPIFLGQGRIYSINGMLQNTKQEYFFFRKRNWVWEDGEIVIGPDSQTYKTSKMVDLPKWEIGKGKITIDRSGHIYKLQERPFSSWHWPYVDSVCLPDL